MGLSLREFYRKFAILNTFTEANLHKRINSTNKEEEEFREILESSFDADEDEKEKVINSKAKRKITAQDIDDLPVLKLNNPQNILVWANIRSYLQVIPTSTLHLHLIRNSIKQNFMSLKLLLAQS